ncbi:bifunctional indole-3-glycerol-phosphate synthase TrpC/phosphoribosylanthranilate isomerase TrpF [Ignatzschineria indica]|uniref:bifunctional indole-3-glycerol-phosphate synthase TrpC/phosphoribosylanthranilate isomerase TrpF n=1 Tax=Ignatzschineria indica TaxID=472583 RepID=UPI0025774D0E|nr:bifunctional indole-3-glycerol-phosphate synthase TrpC/phosphoribosylanthranilate isomerase TrpF [Ignatzschineria indica]MDM1544730.1 bifunctional indole-3-glycerol-phosphate synthase TrpC/phosphoribosylanthranilate isomerase TrpF [Ignatzschineria indica]
MSETVLGKIVEARRKAIAQLVQEMPLTTFEADLNPSDRDFYQAIEARREEALPAYILECKRSSPSKGLICEDFDLPEIVQSYSPYATAVSVLTEPQYFGGDFINLKIAKAATNLPILCKDFIVDAYQIYLARYYGADAVLLMLSVLRDDEYRYLANIAHTLGMGVLTEVNDEDEVRRALKLRAKVIGINNRDLRDLSIDLGKSERLRALMPAEQIVISESGIRHYHDIRKLSQSVDGFLIGSHLMGSPDLDRALHQLLVGGDKVCGLTSIEDAQAAFDAGAQYGGLIFILTSPRGVTYRQAKEIRHAVPLEYIGVFQNDDIDAILFIAKEVGLSAIQLHGHEPQHYISELRAKLPRNIKIIKAINIQEGEQQLPFLDYQDVDHYLLDGKKGGSGEPFDWSILEGADLSNLFLAGGIDHNNIVDALSFHPLGVDLNSGVEALPGKKDAKKLEQIFQLIAEHKQPIKINRDQYSR